MANKRNPDPIKNDGKDSESIFESGVQRLGYAVFRLRDKRDLHGLNGRAVAAFGQPSDFIVVTPKGAFLAEVKSSHEKTSFPLSCFTPAQRSAMARCVACNVGHNYVIYIHNMLTDEWYITDANWVVEHLKQKKASIRWENLQSYGDFNAH